MARSINDGHGVFLSVEFQQGNVDGDPSLPLSLQLVQHPGKLEGTLPHLWKQKQVEASEQVQDSGESKECGPAHLRCSFLKLLQPPLVNPATFVDKVAGGGGLPAVNVTNNDHVNVSLLLCHG